MNVEMPDGTIVEDVPDGTTQAELARRYDLHKNPAAPLSAPQQNPLPDHPAQPTPDDAPIPKYPGFGQGLSEPVVRPDGIGEVLTKTIQNTPESFERFYGGMQEFRGKQLEEAGKLYPDWTGIPDEANEKSGDLIKTGKRIFDEATTRIRKNSPDVEHGSPQYYSGAILQAMLEMGPALAATFLTRSPAVGGSIMSGQVFGDKYADQIRKGRTHEEATMDGAYYAATEGLSEAIPLGVLTKGGGKIFSRTMKASAAESLQEIVNQAAQIGYDMGILDEDMSAKDAMRQMWDAGIIGAGAGGGLAVVTHPIAKGMERKATEGELANEIKAHLNQPLGDARQTAVNLMKPQQGSPLGDVVERVRGNLAKRSAQHAETNQKTDSPIIPSAEPPEEPAQPRPTQKPQPKVNSANDDLFKAISKLGGLSQEEAQAQGIDPEHFKERKGGARPVFRKDNGLSFDEMAEHLSQHGYFADNEEVGPNSLLEKLDTHLRGKPVYSRHADGKAFEQEAKQREADQKQQAELSNYEYDDFAAINDELKNEIGNETEVVETDKNLAAALDKAHDILDESDIENILERAAIAAETDDAYNTTAIQAIHDAIGTRQESAASSEEGQAQAVVETPRTETKPTTSEVDQPAQQPKIPIEPMMRHAWPDFRDIWKEDGYKDFAQVLNEYDPHILAMELENNFNTYDKFLKNLPEEFDLEQAIVEHRKARDEAKKPTTKLKQTSDGTWIGVPVKKTKPKAKENLEITKALSESKETLSYLMKGQDPKKVEKIFDDGFRLGWHDFAEGRKKDRETLQGLGYYPFSQAYQAGQSAANEADALKTKEGMERGPRKKTKPAKSTANAKLAERFKTMAEKLNTDIENKTADRMTNTPKRVAEAASARAEADRLRRTQQALLKLAELNETGNVPTELAGFKSKKAVYDAMSGELAMVENGYHGYHVDTGKPHQRLGKEALALWGMLEGKSEADIQKDKLRQLESNLVGTKIPGFFPTPAETIQNMIALAEVEPGMKVLEPSAGSGSIADALKKRGVDVDVNEINPTLADLLKAKGYKPTSEDFLELGGKYDRIIMNPPFEKNQDIAHVRHAYDMLKPGGRVVAIVGAGAMQSGQSKVRKEFQQWISDKGASVEDLAGGTFNKAELVRTTGVSSKLLVIDKPAKNSARESVAEFSKRLEKENDLQALLLHERNNGDMVLDSIIVKKGDRKSGVGSKVMNEIVGYADQNNKRILLTPAIKDDYQATTSRARLVKFYKRFGFKENKGSKKDYSISEGMIRNPSKPSGGGTLYANPITAMVNAYEEAADWALNGIESKLAWTSALGGLDGKTNYLTKRYLALGKITEAKELADKLNAIFNNEKKKIHGKVYPAIPESQQKAVYTYLTNDESANLNAIELPYLRREAKAAKTLMNRIGDDLVKHGMIPQESHEAYKNRYLPRVYIKHLLGEQLGALGVGLKSSPQGYGKARNNDIPAEYRELMGEVTDPAYLLSRGVLLPMRDMAILDFLDEVAQNEQWALPKMLVRVETFKEGDTVHARSSGKDASGEGRLMSVFALHDESKALADRAKYETKPGSAAKMLSLAKEYDQIAKEALDKQGAIPENYLQIPQSKRYGLLRGMWVRKEIYHDVVGARTFGGEAQSAWQKVVGEEGYLTKATRYWKVSKVALNYPSQVRNFVSNGVLLQLSGVPIYRVPDRLINALNQIRINGKHYKVAKKYGVLEATFSNNEMARIQRHWLKMQAANKGKLSLPHMLDMASGIVNAHSDFYQFSESLFKTAKIIDAMEREGKDEATAAMAAHEALFDYSLVSDSIRYARNAPLGAPFITFFVKSLAQLSRVSLKHPARFLPWVVLYAAMEQLFMIENDVDEDDYKALQKALPKWLEEKGGAVMWPFKDENDKWQAIDVSYFFPWQAHLEWLDTASEGDIPETLETFANMMSPVADIITAIQTGIDPFSQREIYNENDPPGKKAGDLLRYSWRLVAPTYMTDIGVFDLSALLTGQTGGHLANALTGKLDAKKLTYGQPTDTVIQGLARIVGVNIYPIDPEKSRIANISRMQWEMKDLQQRTKRSLMDPNMKPDQRKQLIEWMNSEMALRQIQLHNYKAESEINPKLKTQDITNQLNQ